MLKIKKLIKKIVYNRRYIICRTMNQLGRNRTICVYEGEYIRLSSLELVANEINTKNLEGSVAEVGVSRGEFAKWINQVFPNRKLYLFDTFEGFDERDAQIDRAKGYSNAIEKFPTSIELVKNKMKNPGNCIFRKGWFPESAHGISDKFTFVSIDVDLYKAITSCLEFFYPLLVKGGYMFVHDYNSNDYRGVKPAVRKFCKKEDINFFPLTDGSGSAIILK